MHGNKTVYPEPSKEASSSLWLLLFSLTWISSLQEQKVNTLILLDYIL